MRQKVFSGKDLCETAELRSVPCSLVPNEGEPVVELVLVVQLPMATQAAAASSAPPGLLESPVLGRPVVLPGLYGASRQWLEARLGEGALMRSPGTVGLVLALISAIF